MTTTLLAPEDLAPVRPLVAIDGRAYELARRDDFGLRQSEEHLALLRRLAELVAEVAAHDIDELRLAVRDEIAELLEGYVAQVLRAPAPVRARLTYRDQMTVALAFQQHGSDETPPAPVDPKAEPLDAGALAARLSAAYGPHDWFALPLRELLPFVAMLARLEAHDSQVAAERIAVGVGRLSAADHRAIQARWQRAAAPAAPMGARTPAGLVAVLAAAGVPVKVVPRQAVTKPTRRPRRKPDA